MILLNSNACMYLGRSSFKLITATETTAVLSQTIQLYHGSYVRSHAVI